MLDGVTLVLQQEMVGLGGWVLVDRCCSGTLKRTIELDLDFVER